MISAIAAGPKHRRPIVLSDWQDEIVRNHPRELVRGLIHSDGCRVVNSVTVHNSISIARRDGVAALDEFIGSKH